MTGTTQFKSLNDWAKAEPNAYAAANRNGMVDELCRIFGWVKQRRNYWIRERCIEEALKYNSIKEWQDNSESSYQSAILNGWRDECITHMTGLRINHTKENAIENARRYSTIKEWRAGSNNFYQAACNNGWLDECIAHMDDLRTQWISLERVLLEAKKYTTRSEWSKSSGGSYNAAKENGWFEECVKHMKTPPNPKAFSFETVLEKAKTCKTVEEFKKVQNGAYKAARKNGWFLKCISHMTPLRVKWTKELCLLEALKYTTRGKWQKASSSSIQAARTNGWYEECTAHMEKRKTK